MNLLNAFATAPYYIIPAALLISPALADVPFMNCQLERIMPNDARKIADAGLRTYTTSGQPWLEIAGTHQDPTAADGDAMKMRGFRLAEVRSDKGQSSWSFSNQDTSGVMSIYASGRVDLTLHIQGSDHTYVELFSGPCKEPF